MKKKNLTQAEFKEILEMANLGHLSWEDILCKIAMAETSLANHFEAFRGTDMVKESIACREHAEIITEELDKCGYFGY